METAEISIQLVSQECRRDINNLLEGLVDRPTSLEFSCFLEQWRKMNFHQIFRGRKPEELAEFFNQLVAMVKLFIFEDALFEKRVGAIYLLYGIYYSHPDKVRHKIRMSLGEFKLLLKLVEDIKKAQIFQASYIFYSLVLNDAFHFCATSLPRIPLSKQRVKTYLNDDSNLFALLDQKEDEQLNKLMQTIPFHHRRKYPSLFCNSNTNFLTGIFEAFKTLSNSSAAVQNFCEEFVHDASVQNAAVHQPLDYSSVFTDSATNFLCGQSDEFHALSNIDAQMPSNETGNFSALSNMEAEQQTVYPIFIADGNQDGNAPVANVQNPAPPTDNNNWFLEYASVVFDDY